MVFSLREYLRDIAEYLNVELSRPQKRMQGNQGSHCKEVNFQKYTNLPQMRGHCTTKCNRHKKNIQLTHLVKNGIRQLCSEFIEDFPARSWLASKTLQVLICTKTIFIKVSFHGLAQGFPMSFIFYFHFNCLISILQRANFKVLFKQKNKKDFGVCSPFFCCFFH